MDQVADRAWLVGLVGTAAVQALKARLERLHRLDEQPLLACGTECSKTGAGHDLPVGQQVAGVVEDQDAVTQQIPSLHFTRTGGPEGGGCWEMWSQ